MTTQAELPIVKALRGSMLQDVPSHQTSGVCSGLPYDAAEIIDTLYSALETSLHSYGNEGCSCETCMGSRAALAKARGDA